MRIASILLFSLLFSFSCQRPDVNQFESFFEQTFNVIESESLRKDSINWTDLKKTVKDSIKKFNSNDDAYKAIAYTIKLINDGHSIFIPAQNSNTHSVYNPLLIDSLKIPTINNEVIDGRIGYIKLTGFFANDSLSSLYVLQIRKTLLALDSSSSLSGWIIDLRNHSGGKLTNEPLGLAPLFSQPLIGIALDNKGIYTKIKLADNKFYFGDIRMDSTNLSSELINKDKKIAVLVSDKTISAGEFLALAFKFQKNSKLFGSKTRGKTSHLKLIEFKSNAKLLLASHFECDINKNILSGGLVPDIECKNEESLSKAIEWITSSS